MINRPGQERVGPASIQVAHGGDAGSPETSARVMLAIQPVPSQSLLRGQNVISIEHNGALYQLRNTRLGKLILTK